MAFWQQQTGNLPAVAPSAFLIAFPAALAGYLLRFLRWHVLLRGVVNSVPLPTSLAIQAIGFALAATPGRMGEALKFYPLARHCRVPASQAGPIFLCERLSDAVGLIVIALLGALFLAHDALRECQRVGTVGLLAGALTLPCLLIVRGESVVRVVRRRSDRWSSALAEFLSASRALLHGPAVPFAITLTILARLCDTLVIALVASAFGTALSYPQAALVLGTAGLAGGESALPGGLGVADATMLGLLIGFGSTASAGLAITLVARVFTFWLWVGIGLIPLAAGWRWLLRG